MKKVVIYKQDNGVVAVMHIAEEFLLASDVRDIAGGLIPKGKPYKILNIEQIPSNRSERDAWTVTDSELTDGIGVRE
jgi:hypothetical protein